MTYECWAYKNSKPYKMIYVSAKDREEAKKLAFEKFISMRIEFDSIEVK